MVTIGMNYQVIPGKGDLFEQKFREVIAAFGQDDGHRASRLYRDVDSPDNYMIHSEWDSKDAFMGFIRSDAFREVTNWGKEQILAGRPQHKIFGEV
ncbi:MAG: antibiotic biosynthesis monooxygenase [Gemmatimonadetes bacterium]|nr:antibiotic biosynthesis monooxygenase [Gemmatimonadota bacterium]